MLVCQDEENAENVSILEEYSYLKFIFEKEVGMETKV